MAPWAPGVFPGASTVRERMDVAVPIFRMEGVCKRYGGVQALEQAALNVHASRVHAVLEIGVFDDGERQLDRLGHDIALKRVDGFRER